MELNKESITALLMKNDKAVGRALLVLLDRQTADEQACDTTRNYNLQGFAPCDAFMMTRLAKFYRDRGFLSPKQLAWLRSGTSDRFPIRIAKYWKQLVDVAKDKQREAA